MVEIANDSNLINQNNLLQSIASYVQTNQFNNTNTNTIEITPQPGWYTPSQGWYTYPTNTTSSWTVTTDSSGKYVYTFNDNNCCFNIKEKEKNKGEKEEEGPVILIAERRPQKNEIISYYCGDCGAEVYHSKDENSSIDPQIRFCPYCGAKFTDILFGNKKITPEEWSNG